MDHRSGLTTDQMSRVLSLLYQAQVDIQGRSSLSYRVKRGLAKLRSFVLRVADPAVTMRVGAYELAMPLSHRVPLLLAENPFYDQVIVRLVRALKKVKTPIVAIDVGANIGDTAAQLLEAGADEIVCVEADPVFFRFLLANWGGNPKVRCRNALLADSDDQKLTTAHYSGTAYPVPGTDAESTSRTLDSIIFEHPPDRVDLLKIDTDGFDFRVLGGAERTLAEFKPVILFEYSPEHYEKIGRVSPMECFSYLAGLGYGRLAVYDSAGILMFSTRSTNTEILYQLTDYATVTGAYYDILSFHDENENGFEGFLAGEKSAFPKYHRPYLPRIGGPSPDV
jgi:FkbM family methyltransferase